MGISPNKIKLLSQVWRKSAVQKPAVFLDRDGTLIRFVEELREAKQVRVFASAARALQLLAESGYLLIMATNQPIVEKGIISALEVKKINEYLQKLLKKDGIALNAAYTCPHRFGSNCACRKPDLGLIKEAQKDFSIDMKRSWFVGDTTRDMETARRAKLKSIHVMTGDKNKNENFFKTKGKYQTKDLLAAARKIKSLQK